MSHCLYDKREIRETMRKSEQKGEDRGRGKDKPQERAWPSMTSARNGSEHLSSLRQSRMQIYDDLIYEAAELLQDRRATFLSFLLRNSFHLPSTRQERILRCSEKKKEETIETSTIAFLLLAERGISDLLIKRFDKWFILTGEDDDERCIIKMSKWNILFIFGSFREREREYLFRISERTCCA